VVFNFIWKIYFKYISIYKLNNKLITFKTTKYTYDCICLSYKKRLTEYRIKQLINFYTNNIINNKYCIIPLDKTISPYNPIQALRARKNDVKNDVIDFWGCAYIPKIDFDFDNFCFKTLKNMKSLEKDNITLADCFFDINNENMVLLEDQGTFETAVISKYDISKGWKKVSDNIMKSGLHSSYPISFKYNKKVYALPSIFADIDEIDFFIRTQNGKFEKSGYKLNVLGKDVQDFTPFEYKGLWYSYGTNPLCNILKLYVSDNPFNSWVEHKCSPINIGLFGSRPAGNIIKVNNNIYRLGQNCQDVYGGSISIFKILRLNKDEYEEQFIKELKLPSEYFSFHTFNVGKDKIIFDYKKYR